MSPLTERELKIVELVAKGWINKCIAVELGLTEGTVKAYVHKIRNKLNLRDPKISRRFLIAQWWAQHERNLKP